MGSVYFIISSGRYMQQPLGYLAVNVVLNGWFLTCFLSHVVSVLFCELCAKNFIGDISFLLFMCVCCLFSLENLASFCFAFPFRTMVLTIRICISSTISYANLW